MVLAAHWLPIHAQVLANGKDDLVLPVISKKGKEQGELHVKLSMKAAPSAGVSCG